MSDNDATPPGGWSNDGSWAAVMPVPDRFPFHWNGITYWGLPIPLRPPDNYEVYGQVETETWFRLTRTSKTVCGWQLQIFCLGSEKPVLIPTDQSSLLPRSAHELFALVGVFVAEKVTWQDIARLRLYRKRMREYAAVWIAKGLPRWTETL